MTRLTTALRTWRCARDHHRHIKAHPPIWSGGYVQCRDCGHRDVQGGDSYGPAAAPWKASRRTPPSPWPALAWTAADDARAALTLAAYLIERNRR